MKPEWKRLRVRRSLWGMLIASIALHGAFLAGFGGHIVYKYFRRPPVQFQTPPPATQRLEPRKLEMNIHATDLSKSSGRPRVKPRLTAIGHASEIALPVVKFDARAVDKKLSRDLAGFGGAGFGSGIGGGYGTGIGGGMGGMGMSTIKAAAMQTLAPPTMLANRCSQVTRAARLSELGGTPECEAAVMRALRWFKGRQNSDGSWGHAHPAAMTGFALLAYLGHCETPESAEFGGTVRNAINWLAEQSESGDGKIAREGGNPWVYSQGIATYALAEAYSITRIARLAPAVEKSCKVIITGQSQTGGWAYNYSSSGHDTSVTGWQIQALKAAHISGLKINGLEACMDRAMENLKRQQAANGSFSYQNGSGHRWSLTGAGVLGLEIWKQQDTHAIKNGIDFILTVKDLDYRSSSCDLYAWYYQTLACFMRGGGAWSRWNRMYREQLVHTQSADGGWPAEGSGKTDSMAHTDGPYFRTALCTLMLEVYYRFLPSTR